MDALGNPLGFALGGGQAHDLAGADALLPDMEAEALIADRAFDADARVLEPLAAAGKAAVIPPRRHRRRKRDYDRHLYKARHLIENFFAKLKQFRGIATRAWFKSARLIHDECRIPWERVAYQQFGEGSGFTPRVSPCSSA